MLTEADTYCTYVVRKLCRANWNDNQIRELMSFRDVRIIFVGHRTARKKQKWADNILRYRHNFPTASVKLGKSFVKEGIALAEEFSNDSESSDILSR